ncbi:energy transducer TonB [Emticicia sp. C21]|uniref:energy transducer TonB n=1 Tax=Emticicia sp. C21 TaxID=2302915 RepID=UPI000E34FAC9|nr:energy transducer TonB [Emticicia sp. C21]RFS16011.1 hypothetical protein D0T08_14040 [Emticicia sp. C21]
MRFSFLLPLFFLFLDYKKEGNNLFVEKDYKQKTVYDIRNSEEKSPEFIGGLVKMYSYIGKTLKYEKENGLCVCVNVNIQFDVLEDGELDNVTVYKSKGVCPKLEKELVTVFQNMPKWKPGKKDNVSVRTNNVIIPVRVTMDDE